MVTGSDSYARAISADGTTVVGQAGDADDNLIACYWTTAGVVSIGTLPNNGERFNSDAEAVSDDGSVIVGWSYTVSADTFYVADHAFQWTAAGGMQDITPFYTYQDNPSTADSVTGNGVTVAGYIRVSNVLPNSVYQAFTWTQAHGLGRWWTSR
jgi:probable HAF family extracellular repeat protein